MNKACPFCGHNDLHLKFWLDFAIPYYYIRCNYCKATGPWEINMLNETGPQKAWKSWNERKEKKELS